MDQVTAADLAPAFLDLVGERYGVKTIHLEDGNVDVLDDESFDLIGLYSVLHHIPDYLGAVRAPMRKLRPGGVLYLDHEANAEMWEGSDALSTFVRALEDAESPRVVVATSQELAAHRPGASSPSRHLSRYRRWRNPRFQDEGNIHIWPDDHIELADLERVVAASGGEVVHRRDYLLYRAEYPVEVWKRFANRCTDTGTLIARRTL